MKKNLSLLLFVILLACTAGCATLPETLVVDAADIILDIGESVSLPVFYTPDDAEADNIVFVSEDQRVAGFKRDENAETLTGTITGISEGETAVYVQCGEDLQSNTVVVTVVNQAKKAAAEISEKIASLADITLEDAELVQQIRALYDEADSKVKSYIDNERDLFDAEAKLAAEMVLQETAAPVVEAIDLLGEITLDSDTDITALKVKLNALPYGTHKYISNLDKLEQAEKQLIELETEVARPVMELIETIGEVSLDSEMKLAEVRSQYEKLKSRYQRRVGNRAVLDKAEQTLLGLETAAAEPIIDEIEAIGTLADESKVSAVREKYNALPEQVKKHVYNIDKLEHAEDALVKAQNNTERDSSAGGSVLVTKTGSKYHVRKCGNGTYYPATMEEARARGLTPCSKCY